MRPFFFCQRGATIPASRETEAVLIAALISLLFGALLGSWLAVLHFDGRGPRTTPWQLAIVHVVLALGGFAALLAALAQAAPETRGGNAGFATAAAVLLALAALVGAGIFVRFRRKRRPASGLVGVHASLAVFGIVILAAYVLSG